MKTEENQTREDKLKKALLLLVADAISIHAEKAEVLAEIPASEDEAKAKMSIALEWDAGSHAPKIVAKVSYGVRYKDEFEAREDFGQSVIDFSANAGEA